MFNCCFGNIRGFEKRWENQNPQGLRQLLVQTFQITCEISLIVLVYCMNLESNSYPHYKTTDLNSTQCDQRKSLSNLARDFSAGLKWQCGLWLMERAILKKNRSLFRRRQLYLFSLVIVLWKIVLFAWGTKCQPLWRQSYFSGGRRGHMWDIFHLSFSQQCCENYQQLLL